MEQSTDSRSQSIDWRKSVRQQLYKRRFCGRFEKSVVEDFGEVLLYSRPSKGKFNLTTSKAKILYKLLYTLYFDFLYIFCIAYICYKETC